MNGSAISCGKIGGLVFGVLVAVGCDSDRNPAPESERSGIVALVVLADDDVVGGFQIDIDGPAGVPAASRFVPSALPSAGSSAGTFFTLPSGDYTVTATAMNAPGEPTATCSPASAPATILGGQTTEVSLVTRCHGKGRGGLGVSVGANFQPEFTAATYNPASTVALCQPATLTVETEDREGDPVAIEFHVVAAPPPPYGGTGSPYLLVQSGNRAVLTSSIPGDFQIQARACDPLGCAELRLPVHVVANGVAVPPAGVACTTTCEDANPCTTDTWNVDGTCAHTATADGSLCSGGNLRVKLLGINDFHGQIEAGRLVAGRPVGGAAVLSSYLRAAQLGVEDQTIIVHAGDHVGASPPASALLQDEPSVSFLNLLANESCRAAAKMDPACNLVGTLGNHEFDEGKVELMRLLAGGNHGSGPFLDDPYGGARFPTVCANVIDETTNLPILPPYVIKKVRGVSIAFIGAVLKDTPTVVTPTGVAGLKFQDEAEAINGYIPELRAAGVRAIVVTIHQGGTQTSFTGPTRATPGLLAGGDILRILDRLDDDVDVVVSGHSHAFTNTYVPNARGKSILVTQAFSASTAYTDIDLLIDPVGGDIVAKTAQIVTTFGDAGPGLTPDPTVAAMVSQAQTRVAPLVSEVVGFAPAAISQTENAAGESPMGNLIADAQRAAMETDVAFMNPGGIRAGLNAGDITWGELFVVQPFGNNLVRMNLTGAQIRQVLEQQWLGQPFPRIMKVSGLTYTWDPARPIGSRVVEVRQSGVPISPSATYSVTCNNFMSTGGDNFTTFVAGTDKVGGPIDLDALVDYVEAHTPVAAVTDGRIAQP
ncbi:MAG: bifunctional metallophosphatase/5'-nucleotidase [Pseudomonadota bacterium]